MRDVLWISLESARHDHTSLAGYARDTTPFLKRLADGDRGVSFSDCYSHDIWTRASVASMLTGHASSSHRTNHADAKLPKGLETVPEAFRDAGYRTVGISPNPQISEATGLDRGFDEFHYIDRRELPGPVPWRILLEYARNVRRHSAGFSTDPREHCFNFVNARLAERRLRRGGDDPVFLFTHFGDTHHPYCPPVPYRTRFDSDLKASQAVSLCLDMTTNLHEYIGRGVPFSTAEMGAIRTMYDCTLRYADAIIERLVTRARQQLDDPIVVVVGDHGELFGEEQLLAHMLTTNRAVSNVPAVVSGVDASIASDGLAQPADLMALVLAACGIDHELPAAADLTSGPREFAVVQRSGKRARQKLDLIQPYATEAIDRYPASDVSTVVTAEHRLERTSESSMLYRRGSDTTPVEDDSVAERLDTLLDVWLETNTSSHREDRAEFSTEMQTHLADLGYLESRE